MLEIAREAEQKLFNTVFPSNQHFKWHPHPATWGSASLCSGCLPKLACPVMCPIIAVPEDGNEDALSEHST